jgi:hypothetical protein
MSLADNIRTGSRKRPRLPNRYAAIQFFLRLCSLLFSIATLAILVRVSIIEARSNPLVYTGLAIALPVDVNEILGLALKRKTTGMRRVSPGCIVVLEIIPMILLGVSWVYLAATSWPHHDEPDHPPERNSDSSLIINSQFLSIPLL